MKASELKGRAVISLADAQKVGEIDNILVDCSQNQVVGFRVKHGGLFSSAQVLRAHDVRSVGPDAITIPNRELLVDRETASDLQGIPDLNALSGINVVSESGTLVGSLDDVDMDGQNMAVTGYYLGGSLWEHLTGGTKRFAASPGLRFGGKLLVIPDSLAATLNAEAKGSAPADTAAPALPPLPPADPVILSPAPPAVADAAPTPYPAPANDAGSESTNKARSSGMG